MAISVNFPPSPGKIMRDLKYQQGSRLKHNLGIHASADLWYSKKYFVRKTKVSFSWFDLSISADSTPVVFANMLNEMRYGELQESTIQIFKTLDRKVTYTDGIEPTEM